MCKKQYHSLSLFYFLEMGNVDSHSLKVKVILQKVSFPCILHGVKYIALSVRICLDIYVSRTKKSENEKGSQKILYRKKIENSRLTKYAKYN